MFIYRRKLVLAVPKISSDLFCRLKRKEYKTVKTVTWVQRGAYRCRAWL